MEKDEYYVPFDAGDAAVVKRICIQRWKDVAKRFVLSFALPFLLASRIVSFVGIIADNAPPDGFDGSKIYKIILFLWTPVFFFIAVGNLILFFKYIPSIHIDMLKGRKKITRFYPERYALTEFDKVLHQIPFAGFSFF